MKPLCLVLVGLALLASGPAWAIELHVSPAGDDDWSGLRREPNAQRTDGPLATVTAARDRIRTMREDRPKLDPVTVHVSPGVYRMGEPLRLEPRDSHVTYRGGGEERPVLSGGQVIAGWRRGEGELWSAPVAPEWQFSQLFVNGQRRTRARTPNEGYCTILGKAPPEVDPVTGAETPTDRTAFVYAPGDIKTWPRSDEINVVVYHSWETSRLRIKSLDEQRRIVRFTGPAAWPFESWGPGQRYFVENAPDGLDAPGEWYLDPEQSVLRYWPLPGEDMTEAEVVAPRLRRLVELRGAPELGLYVEGVTFDGLSLQHQDWMLEPEGHSDPQAVVTLPAAIMADGALGCTFTNCEIAHVGEYALWLRHGCTQNRIVRNRITDLGAGGVRIGEAAMAQSDAGESSHNLVDNNHIYDAGHVYPAGVGIWVAQSSYNTISHNDIHGIRYSGMSIGWNWDDAPNRCHHNIIEYNHVHHLMQHELNDGGAIYTLGTSPGSVIRSNLFHDVWPYSAIGWGIYLDATCNQYLVENNIVYNTLSGGLMYHNGGHEHIIRNNVFALSAEQALWPYWERRPNTFERNIIYFTQGELFIPFSIGSLEERVAAGEPLGLWDNNVYHNPNDQILFHRRSFEQWRKLGMDERSVVADPEFVDAAAYDFRLKPTSPARRLGFQQIDTSGVGLYGDPEWVAEARRVQYPPTRLPQPPGPPPPQPVDDDFEDTLAGAAPQGATVSGEEKGASIRVTAERAQSGRHSLKFTDAAGLQQTWQPHVYYQPHFANGTVRQSFDLFLTPGARLFTEWRDQTAYPACIGPSVSFDERGAVLVDGRTLLTVPLETWVHVEIQAELGTRTFALSVEQPGMGPTVFGDLPFRGDDFRELHWVGLVCTADEPTAFYVDNLQTQVADE